MRYGKPQFTLIFYARDAYSPDVILSLKCIDLVAGQLAPMAPLKLVCEELLVSIDRSADQLVDVTKTLHNLQHISSIDLLHPYDAFPRDPALPIEHFVLSRCDQTSFTLDGDIGLRVYPPLKNLEIVVHSTKEGGILELGHVDFPALMHVTLRLACSATAELIESLNRACAKWSTILTLTLILRGQRRDLEPLEPALEAMRHNLRRRRARLALHVCFDLLEKNIGSANALVPFRGSLLQDLVELDVRPYGCNQDTIPYGKSHGISLPSLRLLRMNIRTVEEARTLQWRMNSLLCPNLACFEVDMLQNPIVLEHLVPLLWQLPCTCRGCSEDDAWIIRVLSPWQAWVVLKN